MTNKEIRALAREKRKTIRGLVPVVLALFGVMVPLELALLLPGILAAQTGDVVLVFITDGVALAFINGGAALAGMVAMFLLTGLMSGAGVARASISAWQAGRTRVGELFWAFKNPKSFLRALMPALLMTILLLGWMLMLMLAFGSTVMNMKEIASGRVEPQREILLRAVPLMYGMFLGGIALSLGTTIIGQLYYAIHLWPGAPILEVLLPGLKRAAKALGRFIGMGFVVSIKPFAICYGAMFLILPVSLFMHRYAAISVTVLLLCGALFYLVARLIPYMMLAFAGLEIEVFAGGEKEWEETT